MAKFTGTQEVINNLEKWGMNKERNIKRAADVMATEVEKYAKANRPWTDRTGNARAGLKGVSVVSSTDVAIQLHHGVKYGLYLELGFAGRFAILKPTLDRYKPEIIRVLKKFWGD